jgi:ABC-type dipeptide/oligopeptide/nickel transport system permease component
MAVPGTLIKRLAEALVTLWVASVLIFLILAILPGDPAALLASRSNVMPTPESLAAIRQQYGLGRPLPVRYLDWLCRAAMGDFGRSWLTGADVARLTASRISASLLLGSAILLCGGLLSFAWGGLAALWPNGKIDYGLRALTVIGTALPSFIVGLLAIRFIAVGLGLASVIGDGTLRTLALPCLVGSIGLASYWARPFRSLVAEALTTDWAFAARARGNGGLRLLFVHAIPFALVGFLPFVGIGLAGILAGSIMIETVFSWPGIGPFVIDAIKRRDIPIVQAFALLSVTVYILSTTLTDLIALMAAPPRQLVVKP